MPHHRQEPTIEEHTRVKIARYLPDAIDCAIQSYRGFYKKPPSEDSKEFSAHHSACKAAIAHIELLLKLAAWANLPRNEGEDKNLAGLMADAQAELDRHQEDNNECQNT